MINVMINNAVTVLTQNLKQHFYENHTRLTIRYTGNFLSVFRGN